MVVPATAIVSRTPPSRRIGPPEPLGRNAIRILVRSHGAVALAAVRSQAIGEHSSVAEAVGCRGSAERREHLHRLECAADIAKRERAYETHAILVEEIARAMHLIELSDIEGDHRREIACHNDGQRESLRTALSFHGQLLGTRHGGH